MATTYSNAIGTSNMRSSSRQTRTNPTRTSKTHGSTLRQNSLISNPPPSVQGGGEPHGFYPAIQHFTDAITALPRDYRRHTSLLKEVDAKAWQPEESLQVLLEQCVGDKPTMTLPSLPFSAPASTTNIMEDASASGANSVAGVPPDALSQLSGHSASPAAANRQVFAALRHNLIQIMVTMDEKNHVINNANEELSRAVRRLDNVWPHVADEISEEARLGSLKHWALTDINPAKKPTVATTRREAAANLALLHDNEVSQRSESRREAVAAKTKQRMDRLAAMDGLDEVKTTKKKTSKENPRRDVDSASEVPALAMAAKGKKAAKAVGGAAMEKSMSAALGGRAMSREPSQQDGSKKRKAPASGAVVARKRYGPSLTFDIMTDEYRRVNAAQDSPKLASSPLAGTFGKDAYKRSPALGTVRPVSARARQNSSQFDNSRSKPTSAQRNTSGAVSASTPELKNVAAATGKSVNEVKQSMKETTNSKGDRLLEDGSASNGDNSLRGGLLLERRTSKTRPVESRDESSAANSPRPAVTALNLDRGRSRAANKASSTPTLGSFGEAAMGSSGHGSNKAAKRPARQRIKYDGLHDSLSPKGLPPKRLHKKNNSIVGQQVLNSGTVSPRLKDDGAPTSVTMESLMSATASVTPTGDEADGPGEEIDPMDLDGDIEEDDDVPPDETLDLEAGSGRREEDVVEEDEDGDEERYCYCQTGSYGEMVACDNDDCPREWFHLECIGLKSVPKSAKWYCDDCKALGLGVGASGGGGVSVKAGGNGGGKHGGGNDNGYSNGRGRVNGNGGGR